MAAPLKLRLVQERQDFECDLDVLLVLGRQEAVDNKPGPPPRTVWTGKDGKKRLVVGWNAEGDAVTTSHAQLEPLADGRVLVKNTSNRLPLYGTDLPRGGLPLGAEQILTPPFRLSFGARWSVIVSRPLDIVTSESLGSRMFAPGDSAALTASRITFPSLGPRESEQVLDWLTETAGVLQSAVATDDFLARAAEALVKVVGLQSGRVLLREPTGWGTAHVHLAEGLREAAELSATVLKDMVEGKETRLHRPLLGHPTESQRDLDTVVAAPLLDSRKQVVGALYGEVRRRGSPLPATHDQLHAALATILANAVSAGLALRAAEDNRKKVERDRALFQQFFPRELAEQLSRDRSLIDRVVTRQVTVLFCDIRGFSAASEKLGPEQAFRWVSSVLGKLSNCVEQERGVLVDYAGDELMAMWGAPTEQPDHARLAVRAALAMLRAREELDRESDKEYGVPTNIGIGINSGEAGVGNIGSKDKMKYGPLGDTVNVSSRIQGITKYLKCSLLISADTYNEVRDEVAGRHVVRARLVGIKQPRDLYEVADRSAGMQPFFASSEAALRTLEKHQFSEAVRQAATLLENHRGDGPLRLTLSRASHALVTDGEGFDFVWDPPSK